nr:stage II sporulation protein M [uncultured Methanobacterium sp.]
MSKQVTDNNFWNKFSGVFKGLYNRNKTILTFSVVLFLGFLFLGILIGYFSSDYIGHLLNTYFTLLHESHIQINTLSIFLHNLQAALVAYFGGLIGIIPVGVLSVNGFLYGAFLGYLIHGPIVTSSGVFTPVHFIVYTLPHGILELPGFIIAGAAGFRLTTLVIGVIKSIMRKTPISDHYWKFKDSLVLLAIAIVLIFIAAIIEANITLPLGNYITGLI